MKVSIFPLLFFAAFTLACSGENAAIDAVEARIASSPLPGASYTLAALRLDETGYGPEGKTHFLARHDKMLMNVDGQVHLQTRSYTAQMNFAKVATCFEMEKPAHGRWHMINLSTEDPFYDPPEALITSATLMLQREKKIGPRPLVFQGSITTHHYDAAYKPTQDYIGLYFSPVSTPPEHFAPAYFCSALVDHTSHSLRFLSQSLELSKDYQLRQAFRAHNSPSTP